MRPCARWRTRQPARASLAAPSHATRRSTRRPASPPKVMTSRTILGATPCLPSARRHPLRPPLRPAALVMVVGDTELPAASPPAPPLPSSSCSSSSWAATVGLCAGLLSSPSRLGTLGERPLWGITRGITRDRLACRLPFSSAAKPLLADFPPHLWRHSLAHIATAGPRGSTRSACMHALRGCPRRERPDFRPGTQESSWKWPPRDERGCRSIVHLGGVWHSSLFVGEGAPLGNFPAAATVHCLAAGPKVETWLLLP